MIDRSIDDLIDSFFAVAPSIVFHSANTTPVVHGRAVELVCIATGSPVPNITWHSYDGVETVEYTPLEGDTIVDRQFAIRDELFIESTLRFHEITDRQSSMYRCTASNGISEVASASFALNIIGTGKRV